MSDNPTQSGCGKIADYLPLIQAADGLTLSQVCKLSALEPTTVQNWIKRGYVPHPVSKKYHARHLARILLINKLRESMQIDRIGELLRYINGDADDVSDDIITEEALYDIFCDIASSLSPGDPDGIGECVRKNMGMYTIFKDAEKLQNALTIMAYTHMANLYKHMADESFCRYVTESQEV